MKKLFYLHVALAVIFSAGMVVAGPFEGSRPNIILVMTDDQGMGDLACMGNPILKTPHLDRFYERSTRFTDFQVSPTCAPTRSALMSGRAPFKNGVTHTILQRERMALDAITTHGSIVEYKGQWYLFYHTGALSGGKATNRSICFDKVSFNEDGTINKVGQTLGAVSSK